MQTSGKSQANVSKIPGKFQKISPINFTQISGKLDVDFSQISCKSHANLMQITCKTRADKSQSNISQGLANLI